MGDLREVLRGNLTPLCAALVLYELQLMRSRGSMRSEVLEFEHADGLLDLLPLQDHKRCALGMQAFLQGRQRSFLPWVALNGLSLFWAGIGPE